MISEQDKKYLLSLKPDDLTFSRMVSLLGLTVKNGDDLKKIKSPKFNPTDEMKLTKNDYFVKEDTLTTVGRFIYNKYLIERCGFQDVLGYVNVALTAKMIEKIEQKLINALIEDKITIDQCVKYIDNRDTLGYQNNSVITSSFTLNTLKVPKDVQADKKVLFKKYEKELEAGDPLAAEKIGNELMTKCREKFKGDVGMDLYDSGARGNFGNYKNMMLFKGTSFNNITGKYDIVKSSFMDGIKKEDIHAFGNEVINGSFPKAVDNFMINSHAHNIIVIYYVSSCGL